MGHHRHHVIKCHTCKRRRACGGSKKTGSWDDAERAGWHFAVRHRLGQLIWLCPTCRHKHLPGLH